MKSATTLAIFVAIAVVMPSDVWSTEKKKSPAPEPPSAAADGPYTKQYLDCMNAATDRMRVMACGDDEMDRQRKRLDEAWLQAVQSVKQRSDAAFEALATDQDLWTAWSKKACAVYLDDAFGRDGGPAHSECLIELLAQRAKFLNGLY